MGDAKEKLNEVKALIERLQKEMPQQTAAFNQFMMSVEKPGALDTKTKELINVALSIATQCEWCITLHVKGALTNGASREEVMDAAMQAVLMHGGPALLYLIPVEEALDAFSET
ncbi:carboxymuconolactone decarboxylase family protein [Sulfurovum riftiae]|uniref:Alkylhydroperoxidase n=1 Tax=Sulfurovum riftiae TaxID=1630136 RepID=A0A151CGH3_9BACT|nr:carboxymuconolactone decarboxylase family protein [Sulfurovum riftiae]KYJ86601.1 alkylhydroperoxidase [Sulfurovum riftiae]